MDSNVIFLIHYNLISTCINIQLVITPYTDSFDITIHPETIFKLYSNITTKPIKYKFPTLI